MIKADSLSLTVLFGAHISIDLLWEQVVVGGCWQGNTIWSAVCWAW